jgi:hypothetical protein
MAPYNFDLLVPAVRKLVADKLKIEMKAVEIFLVGHHVLRPSLAGELGKKFPGGFGLPFFYYS